MAILFAIQLNTLFTILILNSNAILLTIIITMPITLMTRLSIAIRLQVLILIIGANMGYQDSHWSHDVVSFESHWFIRAMSKRVDLFQKVVMVSQPCSRLVGNANSFSTVVFNKGCGEGPSKKQRFLNRSCPHSLSKYIVNVHILIR